MKRIDVTHFCFLTSQLPFVFTLLECWTSWRFWNLQDTSSTLLKNLILNLVFGVRLLVTVKFVVNRLCCSKAVHMHVHTARKLQLSLKWLHSCIFLPWIYRHLSPIPVTGGPGRHTHSIVLLGSYLVVTVYKRLLITLHRWELNDPLLLVILGTFSQINLQLPVLFAKE